MILDGDSASKISYDVIVVGAGSTGSTLASRLTEETARSLLLLEAGPIYRSLADFPSPVLDPSDFSNAMPGAPNNWDYYGTMTSAVATPVARGKGMGGSGGINGAYFIRGTAANFDAWARLGNDLWSYDCVLPFYKKLEADRDFAGALHGDDGPIPVRREPVDRSPEFTPAFIAGCRELGIPEEPDKNAGGAGGVGPVPMNIENGRRISSAVGYLLPAIDRPNLHLVGRARVTGLTFDGRRCTGVRAVVDGREVAFKGVEVVLCAGVFRSPQLLLLAGIGPAGELRERGIGVLADSPGVGRNLMDHPELSVSWRHAGKYPLMHGRGTLTAALNWTAEGSDKSGDLELLPFVCTRGQMLRLPGMARRPIQTLNAMRKTSMQLVLSQAKARSLPFLVIGLQQPDFRGRVTLASDNPLDAPVIHWGIFDEANDRRRFHEAIKVAVEIFQTTSMRSIRAELVGIDPSNLATTKSLDDWMSAHIFTVGHGSCTCRMGPESDPAAVVDQRGRVRGVDGLRVADTSIFPVVPSRGPNATAIMIGERLVEFFD